MPTCYKNPTNPSYIGLILTKYPKYFQDVPEKGLSKIVDSSYRYKNKLLLD